MYLSLSPLLFIYIFSFSLFFFVFADYFSLFAFNFLNLVLSFISYLPQYCSFLPYSRLGVCGTSVAFDGRVMVMCETLQVF